MFNLSGAYLVLQAVHYIVHLYYGVTYAHQGWVIDEQERAAHR